MSKEMKLWRDEVRMWQADKRYMLLDDEFEVTWSKAYDLGIDWSGSMYRLSIAKEYVRPQALLYLDQNFMSFIMLL